jgi:hypothetical protein
MVTPYERKVAKDAGIWSGLLVVLVLGLAVGWPTIGPWLFPETKVVTVSMRSSTWIVGEYRTCTSAALNSPDTTLLDCGGGDADEAQHNLSVTFHGQIDTQTAKLWNCQRIQDSGGITSLDCKDDQASTPRSGPAAASDDAPLDWTSNEEPPGRIPGKTCPTGYRLMHHLSGPGGYLRHEDCVPQNVR